MNSKEIKIELLKRELAKKNYYSYVSYTHRNFIDTKHGKFMCDTLNKAIEKKKRMMAGEIELANQYIAISMPPRHGKSMQITETLPSYYLGQFPRDRIIECSYNSTFAQKFGRKNKQKVIEVGAHLFNVKLSADSASATDWNLDNNVGGMISRGILAGVTGEGADLMIIDDPVKNREEANSQVYRDKLWDEWVDTLSTRLHPAAIVIIILTRWHEDDLIGRLLSAEYGEPLPWEVINLSLEAETNDVMERKLGEPLWPERYGYKFIEERKRYPQSFNSLYQGRPTAMEGNMLKRAWWKYYDVLPDKFDEMLQSWDLTFKDSDGSDFVVGQVWGRIKTDKYLIDQVRGRMNFTTTLAAITALSKKWPLAHVKLIEDKANGSAVIDVLRHKLGGIIAITPKESKIARASAISSDIEGGYVYLPQFASFTPEFIEECASFPSGAHDDMVDTMTMALNRIIFHTTPREPEELPKGLPQDLIDDLMNDPKAMAHYLARNRI